MLAPASPQAPENRRRKTGQDQEALHFLLIARGTYEARSTGAASRFNAASRATRVSMPAQ